MKRIALFSTLALVVGAAVLRVLQHDAGYVLISVAGKTIEMRFWFAVILIFVISLTLFWAIKTLLRSIRAISNGWSFAMSSRARRGELRTQSGLVQFIEGDWLGAQKSLLRAAKDVDKPLVHYLAAARSAYETGDFSKAESLIAKAQKIAPENDVSIAVSQARMLFLSEKYDECLSVLHSVKTAAPHHPVVLSLLQRAYLAIADWRSLESMLPTLERKQILDGEEYAALELQVYTALLAASGNSDSVKLLSDSSRGAVGNNDKESDSLGLVWQRSPKKLKQSTNFIALYCQRLLQVGRHDEVEPILQQALKKSWTEPLVEMYGVALPSDFKGQLKVAENWLKSHSESAALHLTLGRICLRNELWGQAKDYFKSSLELQPLPVTYAELARLQLALGESELGAGNFKKGLLMATHGLPNLPMPN